MYQKKLASVTGNIPPPPPPPALTSTDNFVLAILGESPAFKGVGEKKDQESGIVTTENSSVQEMSGVDFCLANNPQSMVAEVAATGINLLVNLVFKIKYIVEA